MKIPTLACALLSLLLFAGCQIGGEFGETGISSPNTAYVGCPKLLFLQYQRGEISKDELNGQCQGVERPSQLDDTPIKDTTQPTTKTTTPPCLPVNLKYSTELSKFAGAKTAPILEGVIRSGLNALSKTHKGANDLRCSGQTLYLVCLDEPAGKAAGFKQPDPLRAGLLGVGSGATKGDFAKDGKPTYKGQAIIGLNCDYLSANQWYRGFGIKQQETMWKVLVHELLHATHTDRKHPPDALKLYQTWVNDFLKVTATETAKAKKAGVK
ncbi:MAG: hypothetical protein EP343_00090 [Deltaproteobacteria bacterium]|nr:MAG: hypothetical protein EP343_00090 [Deltaproteobacteria bacterium]